MRGPLPKNDDERRRRNAPTIPTTNLPVSGYRGSFPAAPGDLDEALVEQYVALWRSPMGAAWIEEDASLVVELVRFRRVIALLLDKGEVPPGTATSRVGAIEDKLGLSPKARAALRWRIVDDPPEADGDEDDDGDFFETRFS